MIIYHIENREQGLIIHIVNDLLCLGYCKAQFWDHFYSTFFLADLFFIHSDIDIANFADDNTPYLFAKNVEDVIESLERASVSLFRWF